MTVHKPVLLKEAIGALELKEGMTVADATLGGGGYAKEILKKIGKGGVLAAFDRDRHAIARFEKYLSAQENNPSPENIKLVNDNYSNIKDRLCSLGIPKVDAIVADLGLSSDQLEEVGRGFSFQVDAPLDMRMDLDGTLTADKVVNAYDEDTLTGIFSKYGQEKYARRIARAIVEERAEKRIEGTVRLASLITKAVPASYAHGKINPATKVFQAIRIEVNDELGHLEKFIDDAVDLLSSGARLAVVTFHSGEDSIVKHKFKEYARGCVCPPSLPKCVCGKKPSIKIISAKPIVPSEEEVAGNPRSRSAKLRVAEKI